MKTYIETSDHVKLGFTIWKSGKQPLLMLHGWGGNQLSFAGMAGELKGDYCIMSYDHRGFGESGKPDTAVYSVERLAQDLHEVIEKQKLKDVILVGWSMGGVVAATYLDVYGHARVTRLVLIDVNVRMLQDERDFLRDLSLIAYNFRLYAEEMPEKCNMYLFTAEQRAAFVEKVTQQNTKPFPLIAMLLAISNTNLTENYKRLDLPVLFCHGGTSSFCPSEDCDRVMRLLPDAELAEFPECSHFIPIERPQQLAKAIDEFILSDGCNRRAI
ncbi:hypothetical protein AGMMS49983_03920 [Clostridia bacterium]|nr:hypothetical protein AGMMS49983_03920 [Clostridia bacterium]